MILAIDPATITGYARPGKSGTLDLSPKKGEATSARVRKFRDWLTKELDGNEIKMVVYEQPTQGHFMATRIHSQLEAVIFLSCEDYGIGFLGLSAGTIKKWATGKGNAKKDAMMQACRERLGVEPVDDNHSDALFILDYATKSGILQFQE